MKTVSLLSAALISLSSTAVFAEEPNAAAAEPQSAAPASTQPSCLTETGSRVLNHEGCTAGHGTSYSREDILGRGSNSVQTVLNSDPAIFVRTRH